MPQSLVKNYTHIVFSTKHREELIYPPYEDELYKYLGALCNEMESQPIKIGGYRNHVHILCLLSRKIAMMKLLEIIKSNSSKWMKTKSDELSHFYWQDGYAAFSVSPSMIDKTIAYIVNQHAHYQKKDYKDEFIALLKKHKMDYDERYVWD